MGLKTPLTLNGLGGDDDVAIGRDFAALIQTLVDLGGDEQLHPLPRSDRGPFGPRSRLAKRPTYGSRTR